MPAAVERVEARPRRVLIVREAAVVVRLVMAYQ
jgi:hypothetical protein